MRSIQGNSLRQPKVKSYSLASINASSAAPESGPGGRKWPKDAQFNPAVNALSDGVQPMRKYRKHPLLDGKPTASRTTILHALLETRPVSFLSRAMIKALYFRKGIFSDFKIHNLAETKRNLDPTRKTIVCFNHYSEVEPFGIGIAVKELTGFAPFFAVTQESWDCPQLPLSTRLLYRLVFPFFGTLPFDRRGDYEGRKHGSAQLDGQRLLSSLIGDFNGPLVVYPGARIPGLQRLPTNRGFKRSDIREDTGDFAGSPLPVLLAAAVAKHCGQPAQIIVGGSDGVDFAFPPERMPDLLYGPMGPFLPPNTGKTVNIRFDPKPIFLEDHFPDPSKISGAAAAKFVNRVLMPRMAAQVDGNNRVVPWAPEKTYSIKEDGTNSLLPLQPEYFLRARRFELGVAARWWAKGGSEAKVFTRAAYGEKEWESVLVNPLAWNILAAINKDNIDDKILELANLIHPL